MGKQPVSIFKPGLFEDGSHVIQIQQSLGPLGAKLDVGVDSYRFTDCTYVSSSHLVDISEKPAVVLFPWKVRHVGVQKVVKHNFLHWPPHLGSGQGCKTPKESANKAEFAGVATGDS